MSSTKMRGLFGKNSIPPPPAGRGPVDVPKPAGVAPPPAATLPEPRGLPTDNEVTVSAAFPFLPESEQSPRAPAPAAPQDDPIADLFDADPPRPSLAGSTSGDSEEAITAPVANIDQVAEPEAVVLEADGASMPPDAAATSAVKAATEESFASLFTSEPPKEPTHVAKVELTRATPGSAHEIAAADFSRDPRSEESVRPQQDPPSAPSAEMTPGPDAPATGLFPEADSDLQGVVFDPDQSVARHLGEVAIDSEMGAAAPSEELRDLPLPQVPAPLSVDDGPMEKPPVRSMRPALIVMALLMVSGGALTLGSLGVLEESPDTYRREAAEARKARETPIAPTGAAPTPAPEAAKVADAPSVTSTTTPPVQEAPSVAAPVAEQAPAAPEPEVVAEQGTEPTPSDDVEDPPASTNNVGGDPIAAGDSLLRAGNLDAALVQYEAALRADSKDHHAMEGLVRIHLARGNAELALPFAEQIVKRRPKRAAYRVLHGQALLGVGDRAGARRAFQEALTLEPGNSDARRLLGS